MGKIENKKDRTKYLILSIVVNLGILFAFKYYNFFSASVASTLKHINLVYNIPELKILLPLGISFYTFQTLGYSIDVYRGNIKPERHFGRFALYVTFFPQLVAGPIERANRLLPQFSLKQTFNAQRATDGLRLMLWGFFKKIVIADRLAIFVDQIYNNPFEYSGFPCLLATYFFAFQIYCDFSAYSDIAIGTSQIMGIDLMRNFNTPYRARSIGEFWNRWHISLSTWFRDYLYIPLGGNRVSVPRWYSNIIIVFLISGLWHGANWTYVVWGLLHGIYLLIGKATKDTRTYLWNIINADNYPLLKNIVNIFITFHIVLFAWIFFRATNLSEAFYIIGKITTSLHLSSSYGTGWSGSLMRGELLIAIFMLGVLLIIDWFQNNNDFRSVASQAPSWARWSLYIGLLWSIILFGMFGREEFIYFVF